MLQSEAQKVHAKTSPAETSMDSAVKPNKSENYNSHQYLLSGFPARHLPDQKGVTSVVPPERRGIECCASGHPKLKSLQ